MRGWLIKPKRSRQGLLAVYGYMIVLAVFDTCFLDWILFANIRRVRLPGTEHMEKEYHQKWFHVKVMLPMLPVFAAGGVAVNGFSICSDMGTGAEKASIMCLWDVGSWWYHRI